MDWNLYFFLNLLIVFLTSPCSTLGSRFTKQHPTNLTELSNSNFQNFLESFDTVITDIDGIIRLYKSEPTDVFITLQKFKELGKKNILISSNNYFSSESYLPLLSFLGYDTTSDEIVVSSDALIWYLKKINFTDKAYVIGCDSFQQSLNKSGFKIVVGRESIKGNVYDTSHLFDIEEKVSAVIVDFDANVNWAKLNMAGIYLKNYSVTFLSGISEMQVSGFRDDRVMGSSYFLDILSRYSKRNPLFFSKPGKMFGDFILERFSLSNSSRVLFIGDSIDVDMEFAEIYNFTKLQIGPGMYLSQPTNYRNSISPVVDYYIDDLNDMMKLF